MYFPPDPSRQFIALSAALTGYAELDLVATGVADALWDTLVGIVGSPVAGEFLSACEQAFAASSSLDQLEAALRADVLAHPKFGPLARNVIALWYLGQWNQLPTAWADAHGRSAGDVTHIVSSQAYVESLVWPTFGAHPQGAKAPGFGSWAEPPPSRSRISPSLA